MNISAIRHLAPDSPPEVVTRLGANNAFIGACQDFDMLIARLQAARVLNFGADRNTQRDWGEVGSIMALNGSLRAGLAFITGTAE